MKKTLLALLTLTVLSFARDFEDGVKTLKAKDYKYRSYLMEKGGRSGVCWCTKQPRYPLQTKPLGV